MALRARKALLVLKVHRETKDDRVALAPREPKAALARQEHKAA